MTARAEAPRELTTTRLVLRQFTADDHPAFADICADEAVMRHIGTGGPLSPDDAWRSMAAMLGHWALLGHGQWALEERATGQLIGRAGFLQPAGWPGFELGYLLARSHWGRGLAREACLAAIDVARHHLGRTQAISLIRPDNTASIRLAESLGARLGERIDFLGGPVLRYDHRWAPLSELQSHGTPG
jgi:RimJ/RimL family protein N-acetyltransferase